MKRIPAPFPHLCLEQQGQATHVVSGEREATLWIPAPARMVVDAGILAESGMVSEVCELKANNMFLFRLRSTASV